MSTPLVPPRPSRSTAAQPSSNDSNTIPHIPPRPIRKLEPSPNRDTRSPLNELPHPYGKPPPSRSSLAAEESSERNAAVTMPSVGQEGSEYASFDQLPPEAHGVKVENGEVQAPEQMRNVAANMPLHAPKASVPQSTAKSRIEPVTRTDSTQAAAAGIGMSRPDDDVHKAPLGSTSPLSRATTNDLKRVPSTEPHPLRQKTSFNPTSPGLYPTTSRPGSIREGEHEHGIPEIGMQIPLNPNAGDVQAPSPGPAQSQFAPGVGFFNDGSSRNHHRKRSSRHDFGPPGSYGLHGHGHEPHDQFEREWIAKHPEQAMAEGYHGPPKPESALSSAELNKLVNQTTDVGMGTDPNMIGTPDENIAWGATQEYASRMTSPKMSPVATGDRKKRGSSGTQPAAQSPLRKAIYSHDRNVSDDLALNDEGAVIHVDPPEENRSKVTGGGAVDGALDLGPRGGNTEERGGWFEERGEGTPILASDELIKRPGSAYMQPAVSHEISHHDEYESDHNESGSRRSSRVPSRPSSRPTSQHGEYLGGNLHRFISHDEHHGSGMHTPLEEIEEYEPLIPEGEEATKPKPKAVKKRPGLEHHHFPSQDIWEDTPMSLQYQTTVETPEPPRSQQTAPPPDTKTTAFETPEEEQARKTSSSTDMYSDNKTLVNKPHARALEELRPGMQRFPSQDIWEDAPDSVNLVTTVSGPQMDETKSPPDDRPTTTSGSQDDEQSRATTGFTQVMRRPSVPARPHKKSKLAEEIKPEEESAGTETSEREVAQTSPDKAKAPAIPDRPKPTVPARPGRASRGEQDSTELSKSISGEGETAASTKTKPAVPARPAGEKIASLKAGFMNDLNNRLRLGPQQGAPKTKEEEREVAEETQKEPLADARKGRAKGPARRKPAASPSASTEDKSTPTFSISTPLTLWQIDESDEVQVSSTAVATPPAETETEFPVLEKALSDNSEHNMSEPPLAQPQSPEPTAEDDNLDERISAAEKDISIKSAEEHEALAAKAVENVSSTGEEKSGKVAESTSTTA